eukprot:7836607-Pyramimonas_sp.AAC.1
MAALNQSFTSDRQDQRDARDSPTSQICPQPNEFARERHPKKLRTRKTTRKGSAPGPDARGETDAPDTVCGALAC